MIFNRDIILFEGMNILKEWVEGYYVVKGKAHLIYLSDGTSDWVRKDSVGQFTGKNDMHGKKEFEGNIIKFKDKYNKDKQGIIKWSDELLTFVVLNMRNQILSNLCDVQEDEIIGHEYVPIEFDIVI